MEGIVVLSVEEEVAYAHVFEKVPRIEEGDVGHFKFFVRAEGGGKFIAHVDVSDGVVVDVEDHVVADVLAGLVAGIGVPDEPFDDDVVGIDLDDLGVGFAHDIKAAIVATAPHHGGAGHPQEEDALCKHITLGIVEAVGKDTKNPVAEATGSVGLILLGQWHVGCMYRKAALKLALEHGLSDFLVDDHGTSFFKSSPLTQYGCGCLKFGPNFL